MDLRDAENHLLSLELFGMRFGLDRIRRLLTALGSPQENLRVVEVVGTNGKSSTVRMAAAILTAHGHRTGAYLSPHLGSFRERIRIDDRDAGEAEFAASVQRAARAAEKVDRTAEAGDQVTQFELLTAAAIDCFARAGVEICVVEAGLGGRYDATNALDSQVVLLTNVSLEHTRWLGPEISDIASEKLDVVRPGGTLVIGDGLHPDALAVAERICAERGARMLVADQDPGAEIRLGAQGRFQRRNFALAMAGTEALLGALDPQLVGQAALSTLVPGRLEVVGENPLTLVDGAHNPAGIDALTDALPELVSGEPLVLCVGIRDDKDAVQMLRPLLRRAVALVATRAGGERSLPPATLLSLAGQLGFTGTAEAVADPGAALARARELAPEGGVVLATGSIYLVADLLAPERSTRSIL